MKFVKQQKLLPYASIDIFNLVNDVLSYPDFLPGFHKIEIIQQTQAYQDVRMHFSYKGFNDTLTTRNRVGSLDDKTRVLSLDLLEGPFAVFLGKWTFLDASSDINETKYTQVIFELEYKLKRFTLNIILGSFFAKFTDGFLNSFVKRAHQVYGSLL